MKLVWAKVRPDARIPEKRDEDAGYDLYPCFDEDWLEIGPFQTRMVPLGVASAFEPGWVIFLKERGSSGSRGIAQRSGVIDAGYRGEYMCPVTNLNGRTLFILKEDKREKLQEKLEKEQYDPAVLIYPYEKALCQAVLLKSPNVEVEEVSFEELQQMESLRGQGRLGSSGK